MQFVNILLTGNRRDAGLAEDAFRAMFSLPKLKHLHIEEEGEFSISLIKSLDLPTSDDWKYAGDPVVSIPSFSTRPLKRQH